MNDLFEIGRTLFFDQFTYDLTSQRGRDVMRNFMSIVMTHY